MTEIVVDNIHKRYWTRFGWHHVLKGISMRIDRSCSLGILGRNGAGKSTLVRVLSGLEKPDKGRVDTGGLRVSWPLGKGSGVHGNMTGRENVRFICRLYRVDYRERIDEIEDFAELGHYLDMPVKTYSAGMRQRLLFGISMAFDFDTYLVDEGFGGGDARFKRRVGDIFESKRARNNSNMIIVSHNEGNIRKFCTHAAILEGGVLKIYDDMEEGLRIYNAL